jgi:hypothetical protein
MLIGMRRQLFSFIGTVLLILIGLTMIVSRVVAQAETTPWTPPANVSRSGGASQPKIAVAPDGTVHLVWWDSSEGELYARTSKTASTDWTRPISVTNVGVTSNGLVAPNQLGLAANSNGTLRLWWLDSGNKLWGTRTANNGWLSPIALSNAAAAVDTASDFNGNAHLAYVQTDNTPASSSGIYYRSARDAEWSEPSLVYGSTYFHAIKPELANVGVAGTGAGPVLVTWDDPRNTQSYYARSADNGRTWSEPQLIETGSGPATQARVAATPDGNFLQLWRDVTASGCGLIGRRSKDGGTTWDAPERVLSGLGRCPDVWTFVPGTDNQLWLIGTTAATNPGANTGTATIAQWDGTQWQGPMDATLTFYDPASKNTIKLNCLNLAFSETAAGIAGCDSGGDVWAAHNAVDLKQLLPAAQSPWSQVTDLSSSDALLGASLPALVADQTGNMIAVWSQASSANDLSTDLYAATQTRDRWSQPAQILSSPASRGSTGISSVNKAEQPAMLIDAQDRLHLAWSGGTDSAIFYSWAYGRDAASLTGWSVPVVISSSAFLNSSPTIAQDTGSGTLYLAYAVPYNEERGIYLAQSTDNGATWSTPHRVFDAAGALWNSVDKPQLAYQPNAQTLHLVWLRATPPGGTDAQAIYYARSTDEGQTWTEPVKIVEGLVDWPRIAVTGAGVTHITWNQSPAKDDGSPAPLSVWAQASDDGGRTWTSPQVVRGLEQVSGPAALISGGGTKAYLTAIGMGNNTESTLLYSESSDKTWQAVSSLGLGQPATRGNALDTAVAPAAGRLGALLREWVWQTDGTSRPAIGVTIRTIAPEQIVAVTTVTPAPTNTPQPSPTPSPTATPRPLLDSDLQQPKTQSTGLPPIVIGAILAAILVVAAVVIISVRQRR